MQPATTRKMKDNNKLHIAFEAHWMDPQIVYLLSFFLEFCVYCAVVFLAMFDHGTGVCREELNFILISHPSDKATTDCSIECWAH